ncbi:hypothetical protein GCM10023149_18260 [Mucilaginibacter gynuensis]|uniref:Uncharacterized protein n=2 Tax=Mucilaginibacter gynuensis TaxID=1302236 RepID=A0ABP8G949_9SPHI
MVAGFLWLIIDGGKGAVSPAGMIVFSIFGAAGFLLLLLWIIREKLIITQQSFIRNTLFGQKEIHFDDVKGFNKDNKNIYIRSKSSSRKIIISENTGKVKALKEWLSQNFINLDVVEYEQERQAILSNTDYGYSDEDRISKLEQAKTLARFINIAGIVIALWIGFYTKPYLLAIVIGIVFPLIPLVAIKTSNGLIKFDSKKNSAHPSLLIAFLAPTIALVFRCIFDFDILLYQNLLLISGGVFIALIVALLMGAPFFDFKGEKAGLIVGIILIYVYSFVTTALINTTFDKSAPEYYHAKVLDKSVHRGKSTTYHLQLAPWGPNHESKDETVSQDMYNSVDVDEDVNVELKKGLLDAPWYVVY